MTSPQIDGWRHLSPLSPVLRGGIVLVAILGYAVSQLVGEIAPWLSNDPKADGEFELATSHPLAAAGVLALVVGAVAGVSWLSWRFTRFRIDERQVELRKGWIFREHRQVPIDRIQSVEVSRPLLAQLLGLAQLIVQSAGGGDSQLKLAFLPFDEANELRRHIQGLASGSPSAVSARPGPADRAGAAPAMDAAPGTIAEDAHVTGAVDEEAARPWARAGRGPLPAEFLGLGAGEGRPIVQVPNGRLLAATLLHSSVAALLVVVVVWAVAAWEFGATGLGVAVLGTLPGIVPVLIGVGAYRVKELLRYGNFSLSDVGDAVRVVYGLTDHRATIIPLPRIQAMEMVQPLWWRPFGWWRIRLNVAGRKSEDGGMAEETSALPVGPLAEALSVLVLLDPRLSRPALETASLGEGPAEGWTLMSPRARLLDPVSWRRTGFTVSAHCVLIRRGRFSRKVHVVPHARIQSLTLRAGPVQQHLGVAGVELVSIPGPVEPRVPHLELAHAERFLAEQSARSRVARRHGEDPVPPGEDRSIGGGAVAKSPRPVVDLGDREKEE